MVVPCPAVLDSEEAIVTDEDLIDCILEARDEIDSLLEVVV